MQHPKANAEKKIMKNKWVEKNKYAQVLLQKQVEQPKYKVLTHTVRLLKTLIGIRK